MGNDEGLELDETDEDEELCEGDEEQVEKDEGEDMRGIQSGGGRQENSLRDYSLKFRGLMLRSSGLKVQRAQVDFATR